MSNPRSGFGGRPAWFSVFRRVHCVEFRLSLSVRTEKTVRMKNIYEKMKNIAKSEHRRKSTEYLYLEPFHVFRVDTSDYCVSTTFVTARLWCLEQKKLAGFKKVF